MEQGKLMEAVKLGGLVWDQDEIRKGQTASQVKLQDHQLIRAQRHLQTELLHKICLVLFPKLQLDLIVEGMLVIP
jgi:hypothetical protein